MRTLQYFTVTEKEIPACDWTSCQSLILCQVLSLLTRCICCYSDEENVELTALEKTKKCAFRTVTSLVQRKETYKSVIQEQVSETVILFK